MSASTVTEFGVLIGDASNAVASTAVGTATHVLTSNGAGLAPSFQAVTGGMAWNDVTGTSQTMAVGNGYTANNASLVTLTLPATAAVGDRVSVTGYGAGGWRIAQNSGDIIHFGSSDTTTGATGRLDSTNRYDSIQLVCVVANDEWSTVGGPQGNITVT